MSDNIQTQTLTITFDADVIGWNSLNSHIDQLKGIVEVKNSEFESKYTSVVYSAESLKLGLDKFLDEVEKLKDENLTQNS